MEVDRELYLAGETHWCDSYARVLVAIQMMFTYRFTRLGRDRTVGPSLEST